MAGLLNVGEMGALALHLMAELALLRQEDETARLTAQELAAKLHASVHTLQKVIRRLTLAELLEGTRGPHGGVKLAEDAQRISLLRILESAEGPVRANGCLFTKRVCPENVPCRFHTLTESMEENIREYFSQTTLADL